MHALNYDGVGGSARRMQTTRNIYMKHSEKAVCKYSNKTAQATKRGGGGGTQRLKTHALTPLAKQKWVIVVQGGKKKKKYLPISSRTYMT